MPKLPQVSGKDIMKALEKKGFVKVGQKGSHVKYRKEAFNIKIMVIVPNHKVIKKGTLKNILNTSGLTIVDL